MRKAIRAAESGSRCSTVRARRERSGVAVVIRALLAGGQAEPFNRDLIAFEPGAYRSPRHHHGAVGHLDDFLVVGRDDENADPFSGKLPNRAVDLGPGPDVDA